MMKPITKILFGFCSVLLFTSALAAKEGKDLSISISHLKSNQGRYLAGSSYGFKFGPSSLFSGKKKKNKNACLVVNDDIQVWCGRNLQVLQNSTFQFEPNVDMTLCVVPEASGPSSSSSSSPSCLSLKVEQSKIGLGPSQSINKVLQIPVKLESFDLARDGYLCLEEVNQGVWLGCALSKVLSERLNVSVDVKQNKILAQEYDIDLSIDKFITVSNGDVDQKAVPRIRQKVKISLTNWERLPCAIVSHMIGMNNQGCSFVASLVSFDDNQVQAVSKPTNQAFFPPSPSFVGDNNDNNNNHLILSALKDLATTERKVYSPNGEDGVLQAIFALFGSTTKTFLQIGLRDSLRYITRHLHSIGWEGTILNQLVHDPTHACIQVSADEMSSEQINSLIRKHKVPKVVDLLVIDQGYNDYHLWDAINTENGVDARVVVAHVNSNWPNDEARTVAYSKDSQMDGTAFFGATPKAMGLLAEDKAYSMVYCESHGEYCFFVKDSLFGEPLMEMLFDDSYFDYESLHHSSNYHGAGFTYPDARDREDDWILI